MAKPKLTALRLIASFLVERRSEAAPEKKREVTWPAWLACAKLCLSLPFARSFSTKPLLSQGKCYQCIAGMAGMFNVSREWLVCFNKTSPEPGQSWTENNQEEQQFSTFSLGSSLSLSSGELGNSQEK